MRFANRWSGGHASTTSSRKNGSKTTPRWRRDGADHAELELALGDPLDDGLRVRDRERDRDARVLALELAEEQRDDGASRAGGRADLERAAELALHARLELLEQLPLEREHPLGPAVEGQTRLRGLDASARPVEQLAPEPLLERPDLQADGRLRHPEPLGRLREALPLDDGAKGSQLTRVHKDRLCLESHFRHDSVTHACVVPRYARLGEEAGRTELTGEGPTGFSPCARPSSITGVATPQPRTEAPPPGPSDSFIERFAGMVGGSPNRRVDLELRVLDIVFSAFFLLIAVPLLLVIAVALLLTSGLPLLYRGRRVGKDGRIFQMLKFRTLKPGAEERLGPSLGEDLVERTRAETTRLGRRLRATQLDELPQLWNVFRGDMSFVGPRPIRPRFFEQLAEELPAYWQRLVVRPGLTGFAQVRRGYETSMAEKLAHDLEWIADRSVPLYLRTLTTTAARVVSQSVRGLFGRQD